MLKRLWTLAAMSLVLGGLLSAQTAPPPFNGIAHIALRVSDLTASREFYKRLGFAEAFALSKDGAVYESFIKINDRQFMELYPATSKDPQIGFLHLCFEGVDLNTIHDDYVGRGLTPTSVRKAGAGNLLFTLEGPEKQNIEYTQYMPGSMHSNDIGKNLGPDRIADTLVTVSLAMNDMAAAQQFYLKQLLFTVSAKNPMLLNLPGNSKQHVEIVSDALGHRSQILLSTPEMKKTVAHLKVEKIPATKAKGTLTITDPDGNLLMIEAR
jgi:catechol 2,3-dioxygenase-like lactoylglutathione lyase family enzyme